MSRLTNVDWTDEAEVAVLISDHWQGLGLGKELMGRLLRFGADDNLSKPDRGYSAGKPDHYAGVQKAGLHTQTFWTTK